MKNDVWIYDLETYPNFFSFCILRSDGSFGKVFEISDRKNQTQEMLKCLRYLRNEKQQMVGFNNIGFDYPILHEILNDAVSAKKAGKVLSLTPEYLYHLAQKQIDSFKGDGFGNTIKSEDEFIKQIDLYKIHHFDNNARRTSLKVLEFNMNSDSVEDLPFEVGTVLTPEQMDQVILYNKHDVEQTRLFYGHTVGAIKFREELSAKLGKDFTNANDTKIGKDFFIMRLEKAMPGSCYKQVGKRRMLNQSKRKYIDLRECLFGYYDFNRPEFNAIVDWFKNKRITETKGVLTDIEEHDLGEVAKYAQLEKKRQKFLKKPTQNQIDEFLKKRPKGWIEEEELKATEYVFNEDGEHVMDHSGDKPKKARKPKISYWMCWNVATTLNVVIDGFRFDFGTGGIHGSVESSIIESDNDGVIIDADVTSMYPSIAIANRVYPEHLGERFCDIYQSLFEERAKHAKGTPENALFKLALNGVYGDSNNQYSPFYDPKYTMTITINGQLSLCLLAERLMKIEGLQLIQCNTDGVTVKLPYGKREEYDGVCSQWEKDVGLKLEYAEYKSMHIRDVNNYIAVYNNGKVKRKGAYEYENLGWHQNHSSKIIAMAAEAVMVYGKDLEEFIRSYKNKWDFLLRAKVPRNSRLMLEKDGIETKLQNVCRYYPCKDGGKLIKIMPPLKDQIEERRLSIDKEWNVKPCNNIADFKWDIDYDYYIENTKKLVLTPTNK